jgi:hypothetical protein
LAERSWVKKRSNLYTYVGNDPLDKSDPTGEDSYLVARPLDFPVGELGYGHSYIVSNASRIGDPKATVNSYGKLKNGRMGNVNDPANAAKSSKTTHATDVKNWNSLSPDTNKNIAKIDAPDKVVDAAAAAVKENTPYSYMPTPAQAQSTNDTNSNSAAFAVADKALQDAHGDSSPGISGGKTDLQLPGAMAAPKVQFKCTSGTKPDSC